MTTQAPSATSTAQKRSRSEPPSPSPTAPSSPATWYCVKGSNDTYWRVDVPAQAIRAKTCKIAYDTGKEQLEQPGLVDREFRWIVTDEGATYPDHEGTALFTRPDKPRATHALTMREQGIPIVAELDDNYISSRKLSLAMRYLHDESDRRRHLEAIGCFDRVIVTTPWLRDHYAKALKTELKQKPEFFVCGNHVDPRDWPERIEPWGPVRVGWMGSPSHVWDIKLAYPALKWAADAGHEVVIIGLDPNWRPQTWLSGNAARRRGETFGFQYRHIPWVDPREFNRQLASYPIDIGLAPLRRDEHTLGKSDVKFLEYTMSGAVTIASNNEVYNRGIRHGETGFLAGGREELLHWTRELCRNARLRTETAAAAVEYVRSERLIEHHAHEWLEAVTP